MVIHFFLFVPIFDDIECENNGLKVLVFDSMSRNGTIRIYRIIKWLDLIEKWDFYQVFIWKKAHIFVYLAKIGGVKFPEKVNKNATTHNNFFFGLFE